MKVLTKVIAPQPVISNNGKRNCLLWTKNSDVCKNETIKKKYAVAYQKEREHILSVVTLCSYMLFYVGMHFSLKQYAPQKYSLSMLIKNNTWHILTCNFQGMEQVQGTVQKTGK
jgi:hypothetical protein